MAQVAAENQITLCFFRLARAPALDGGQREAN